MIRQSWIYVALIAACSVLASCSRPLPVKLIDGGRYGQVKVIEPEHPRGFVIFFTDRSGATKTNDDAAQALGHAGAVVVEVSTPAYLKKLDSVKEKCHYLVGDAEGLSRQVQRKLSLSQYFTPVLAGIGEGATLAELALADAPAATIAGAASLDPVAFLPSASPMCSVGPVQASQEGFRYSVVKSLPGFWAVGLSPNTSKAARDYVAAMERAGVSVQVENLGTREWLGNILAAMITPHWTKPKHPVSDVSNLPLIELPVSHPSRLMAVVLSGDGGWRDLDKTIAEDLQRQGIPVVGVDSLRYFWSKKTPEQTAMDLSNVIEAYRAKWHSNDVALIGYSFGADVLPFAYDRLPREARSHVALLALLGFAKSADFEIRVGGWLGLPSSSEALPVLPATEKIPTHLMQCFYGQDEDDSACPDLAKRGVEVIRTAGGHHFNGDYAALERDILTAFERRVVRFTSTSHPRARRLKRES